MRSLLHISDVHFGPKHLEDRAGAILALVREQTPDYVVISGDLTQRAKPRQFEAARRFVDSMPCPALAVPGNHDVPLYRFWERLLLPFWAWRRHFSPLLEPHVIDDEVVIVGVNSAFNYTLTGGRITRAQRRRVRELFLAAPPGCYRIAVIHHNLVKPPELEDVPAPLQGSVSALEALSSAHVDMVLSGHLHQSYVAPLTVVGDERGGVILCAGTTTSSRGRGPEAGLSTCHWIEIDGEEARVLFYRWERASSSFVETGRRSFPRRSPAAPSEAAAQEGRRA